MSDHPHRFARWHKQNPGVKAPYKAWKDLGEPDVVDAPAAGPSPFLTAADLAPHAAKLGQMHDLLIALHDHVTGPRRLVKDEHGRAVAVQTGRGVHPIQHDPQTGRPIGVGPLEN